MTTTATKINGIDTEALRDTMSRVNRDASKGIVGFQVKTDWTGGTKSTTRVDGWSLAGEWLERDFAIEIDEPPELLGEAAAPNPQEYLLASVNACMLATYVAACSMQGITLEHLQIETKGGLDLRGFLGLDKKVKPGYAEIEYTVHIKGDGTGEQFQRVHEWVKATSPNYWNMANAITMKSKLCMD